jgi:hypothetical protein
MPRQHDPALLPSFLVYRRIPPYADRVTWGEDGIPSPSTQNFRDRNDELSVYLAHETTPDRALAGHAGFGLVQFLLQDAVDAFEDAQRPLVICRDDDEPDNGHILLCGKATPAISRSIRNASTWVEGRWPTRELEG